MNSSELEKIARNEALFREVNERIAETAVRLEADEMTFVCECADPRCTHLIGTSLDRYERVRADGDTFLLVPGHEDERVEAVVALDDDCAVVQKRQPLVRRLVLALDPRSA